MAIGTGQTHHQTGIVGGENISAEELGIEVLNQRLAYYRFLDFDLATHLAGAGNLFNLTQVGAAGTFAALAGNGGFARLASGAADNTGVGSLQIDVAGGTGGTGATLVASTSNSLSGLDSRIIACGARFAVADYSVSDWFFGLAAIDTTLLLATGLLAAVGGDNIVGFHHCGEAVTQGGLTGTDGNDVRLVNAGTAVANMVATRLSAANQPMPAPADADIDGIFVEYAVKLNGLSSVEFYRNGVLRHRAVISPAMASVALVPSFAHITAGGGGAANMDIDYVWYGCTR